MKQRFFRLATALLLALSLAAVMIPAAYAVTPEEEAALEAGQRSIKNPGGVFAVPEPPKGLPLFHSGTRSAAWLLGKNVFQQFVGKGDPGSFRRVMAYAPIAAFDDELPPVAGYGLNPVSYLVEKGMRNMYIVFLETEDPDVYHINLLYSTRAGEPFRITGYTYYNARTGIFTAEDGKGIVGIGYNYDADQQMIYGAPHGWHGAMGFNIFYDMATPLIGFNLDTLRFRFEYDGKDWMVQLWKGIYAVANGGEIGIYEKPTGRPIFYDASEDTMLDMTMKVYQGDRLYIDYADRTWWGSAMSYASPVKELYPPEKLRMTGTVAFEDQGMADAFFASFQENKDQTITGAMDGLVFSFDWKAK